MSQPPAPLVFLVAGEPSGDALGARLMAALRRGCGGRVRFAGVGGPAMEGEGLKSLFPMADLSVMGFAEVLPRLPRILLRMRQAARAVLAARPSVLVTIDSPGFCLRMIKRIRHLEEAAGTLRAERLPIVHYVAPTVWAWRPDRARKIARWLDHLMVLLPFEPPYFLRHGLPTTFVGHPVVESGADKGDGEAFRKRAGIPAEAPLLAVLPGSRVDEVGRLLPVFAETVRLLYGRFPDLHVLIATVPAMALAIREATASWPLPVALVDGSGAEKFDAFAACTAALAASGTVSLELGLAGIPVVIGYRVHPLSAAIARRLVKVESVVLINLILDRRVIPEFLQESCRPGRLAEAVAELIEDAGERLRQVEGSGRALRALGHEAWLPSERAAGIVLKEIQHGEARGTQHDRERTGI
ncbi:MAG: lipid-A-disaccharide synthase [Proteobacteria bacterium]|nr:lipid-A-disaccharide synthase [Pseudomonadota bacterium]